MINALSKFDCILSKLSAAPLKRTTLKPSKKPLKRPTNVVFEVSPLKTISHPLH